MANPATRVADYLATLNRSRLLPAESVATLVRNWKGADTDVDGLRRLLVAGKHLTEYQSVMVQRGHAEGYFLGGYVVQDRIGKGQSAGVYLGKHPSGQLVALKVLPSSKAKNPNVLGRFQREGRLLTRLDHPNVVRAFQLGSDKGVTFIAMEHLDGETLDDVIARRGRLPSPEACRLVDQLLDGLEHLHDNGMIHRDVKPSNLMLVPPFSRSGPDTTLLATLKLVDIGLGRGLFDEVDPGDDSPNLNLTREGAILGTPDYLAPEQARDARSADIRSDIYSAGCVLFHLIAGRPPFTERNVMSQMVKHASEPLPRITEFAPEVPPALQLVLDKMTAKNPADRFQTPFEAAEAMQLFLPEQSATPVGTAILPAFQSYLVEESKNDHPVVHEPNPPPKPPRKPKADRPTAKSTLPNAQSKTPVPIRSGFEMESVEFPPDDPGPDDAPLRTGFVLTGRDVLMAAVGFLFALFGCGLVYAFAFRSLP
jgi:serine/threonine protein kinase